MDNNYISAEFGRNQQPNAYIPKTFPEMEGVNNPAIKDMNPDIGGRHFDDKGEFRLDKSGCHSLKDSELTLIHLIVEGKSNRQIAETIFLSEGRVKNILTGLYGKLNLKNRYQLINYAYKNNLTGKEISGFLSSGLSR